MKTLVTILGYAAFAQFTIYVCHMSLFIFGYIDSVRPTGYSFRFFGVSLLTYLILKVVAFVMRP